jgi:hypothetical protein
MATVTVTMIAPDGQRHAVTVEAKSLYTAIFQYNYRSFIFISTKGRKLKMFGQGTLLSADCTYRTEAAYCMGH